MASKRNKGGSGGGDEGKEMITDTRFSKAHTDPRFRRLPRRESKVTIDSRFKGVLTDKASAPVDKRGKRRRRGSAKDSLKEYYRIEEDDKKKKKKKKQKSSEEDDESEGEEKLMALQAEAKRRKSDEQSSEQVSDEEEEESEIPLKLASSDGEEQSDENAESEEDVSEEIEEEEEEDTDEDDEAMYADDEPEVAEEEIASIEKETHRLAIVNMDWRHVSASDLYVVFNSFLPKDGCLLSVAVYPSEFGLERMEKEEIHGPAIGGDKKNEDNSDDEEEEDADVINERLRDYEKSRLRYFFAVAVCDSSATADHLYKSCDGIEFERSSNKLDLRFIPDSMEFKHPPRDIATEAPAAYQGLDFQSQALQMSKVNISWDEDEPQRVKILNRKFNADQMAELERMEFLASDESESEYDDDDGDAEKRKDKYRALMESGDADPDKDEDEENDQDMEVEFNTGLEDLSNKFREKKEEKPETVWDAQLRKMRDKKNARRMQKKDDDADNSSDDGDNSSDDDKKKKKKKKKQKKKNKEGLEEKLAADEKSRAELELILTDGNVKVPKGYNIKGKGKKKSKEMAEEKIPSADPDDSRFSAALTDPNYALDPTNPHFKRSATYVKQLNQKQKEDPRSQEQVKDVEETKKASVTDGTVGSSKKRSFAESATVKSLKLKMQNKASEKKKEGTSDLAQRVKKKAKALSNQ